MDDSQPVPFRYDINGEPKNVTKQELLAHARLFSVWRTLSAMIPTDEHWGCQWCCHVRLQESSQAAFSTEKINACGLRVAGGSLVTVQQAEERGRRLADRAETRGLPPEEDRRGGSVGLHTTRGDSSHFMLIERINTQPEVIRAMLMEAAVQACGGDGQCFRDEEQREVQWQHSGNGSARTSHSIHRVKLPVQDTGGKNMDGSEMQHFTE